MPGQIPLSFARGSRLWKWQLGVFGLIASMFGLGVFGLLLHWHSRFEKRRAAVAAGQVPAVILVVRSVQGGSDSDGHWPGVWFDDARFHDKPFRESSATWHPIAGDTVPAFRFGPGDYYIPTADNGEFGSGMAIFLTLGCLPALIAFGLWIRRSQSAVRSA